MFERFMTWLRGIGPRWEMAKYQIMCAIARLIFSQDSEVERVKESIRVLLERKLNKHGYYSYDLYWQSAWPYSGRPKEYTSRVNLSWYKRESDIYKKDDPDKKLCIELDNEIFKIADRLMDLKDETLLIVHFEEACTHVEVA